MEANVTQTIERSAAWALNRQPRPVLFRQILLKEIRSLTPFRFSVLWPAIYASVFGLAANALTFVDLDLPVAVIAGGVWIVQIVRHRQTQNRELSPIDRDLQEEFGRENGWIVDLLILQGNAPTGADRGMIWIEDGRLFFVGQNTSFGLSPSQVQGASQWNLPVSGLRNALNLPLATKSKAGPVSISLEPILHVRERLELAKALKEWAGQPSNLPEAIEGQLPPLTIGGNAMPSTGLFTMAVANSLYWAGLLVFLAYHHPLYLTIAAIAGWLVFAWYLDLFYPWHRWRAWLHRRRLHESEA